MRELMCRALTRQSNAYQVVADVGTAAAAASACRNLKPDLLVLDINLPDASGVSVVPEIKRASPKTRILLCTAFPAADWIAEATHCGADGFVEKTNTWDDFMVAVDLVSRGHRYFCSANDATAQRTSRRAPVGKRAEVMARLSPREKEVLKLITAGLMTKEIATRLFISVPTVESHRAKLMRKTGSRNLAGLVRFAIQSGLSR